ncbi:MAG: hypothetical protein GC160_20750 [Acidobacteria bacterium]|nr:hypothetical protein [Acidobacteriota bacterium]
MKTSADLLFDHVIGLIEPLTRFDRTSLARTSERITEARGEASVRCQAQFEIDRESKAGKLPSVVRSFPNAAGARQAAEAARRTALAELPARLEAWAVRNRSNDSRLAPGDCFAGPSVWGCQTTCSSCGGAGKKRCHACGGQGRTSCGSCHGRGRARCSSCGGGGNQSCGSCGGMGRQQQAVTRSVWDGYNNRYNTETTYEYRNCATCMGTGRRTCSGCYGSGEVTCWTCSGSGSVGCSTCGSSGSVSCSTCSGTGALHETWRLRCSVSAAYDVQVAHGVAEVAAKLRSLSLADLGRLASVTQLEPHVSAAAVRRRYAFACRISQLVIQAGDQAVSLVGYSGGAHVFDFKNIVGVLLEGDLQTLEQAVQRSEAISLQPQPILIDAVNACLQSEANVHLGENGEAKQRLLADGGLGADYAARLTAALRTAFRRLYFGEVVLGAAIAALVPAVTGAAAFLFGLIAAYGPATLLAPPLLGAALFAGFELIARRRLAGLFGGVFEQRRIDAMLRGQKVLRRWRLATAAVAAVFYFAAMWSVTL